MKNKNPSWLIALDYCAESIRPQYRGKEQSPVYRSLIDSLDRMRDCLLRGNPPHASLAKSFLKIIGQFGGRYRDLKDWSGPIEVSKKQAYDYSVRVKSGTNEVNSGTNEVNLGNNMVNLGNNMVNLGNNNVEMNLDKSMTYDQNKGGNIDKVREEGGGLGDAPLNRPLFEERVNRDNRRGSDPSGSDPVNSRTEFEAVKASPAGPIDPVTPDDWEEDPIDKVLGLPNEEFTRLVESTWERDPELAEELIELKRQQIDRLIDTEESITNELDEAIRFYGRVEFNHFETTGSISVDNGRYTWTLRYVDHKTFQGFTKKWGIHTPSIGGDGRVAWLPSANITCFEQSEELDLTESLWSTLSRKSDHRAISNAFFVLTVDPVSDELIPRLITPRGIIEFELVGDKETKGGTPYIAFVWNRPDGSTGRADFDQRKEQAKEAKADRVKGKPLPLPGHGKPVPQVNTSREEKLEKAKEIAARYSRRAA